MMKVPRTSVAAAVAAALAAATPAVSLLAQRAISAPVVVRDGERDLELLAADLSPDGAVLWVTLMLRNPRERAAAPAFAMTSVDVSGKADRIQPVSLDAAGLTASKSPRSVLAVLGVDRERRPWTAVPADAAARLTPLAPDTGRGGVSLTTKGVTVQAIEGLPTGGWLIAGGAGTDGYLAEIDAAGRVAFEHPIGDAPLLLTGAMRNPRGGWVAAGSRGIRDGGEQAWIGALDAKRQLRRRQVYPGRSARVAVGADGLSAVVFHQTAGSAVDVVIKGFSPEMEEIWSRTLFSGTGPLPPFGIASLPGGRFVVAGSTPDKGLWIQVIDAKGQAMWTEARKPAMPELELVGNVAVHTSGDTSVVAYSAFVLDAMTQRQVIKVVRVTGEAAGRN